METFLDLVEPIVFTVDPAGVPTPLNKAAAQWLGATPRTGAHLRELFGCGSAAEVQACARDGATRTVARNPTGAGEVNVRWDFAPASAEAGDGEVLAVGITLVPAGDAAALLAKETLIYKRLVLNILPRFIADTLMERKAVQPKAYREATIMFVDAVGFARAAAELDPVALLRRLDHYFSRFDQITGTFGVEKIKTNGDAYIAASGIPHRKPLHAVDAALAALEIVAFVAQERAAAGDPPAGEASRAWNFRVGIHSGPCISGVLGAGKYMFDLWGGAVNGAAEMERTGAPGRVHVSNSIEPKIKNSLRKPF
jgi:class 3 adenylate cyclase